jgi:GR25 family glycosyltransferase involved in LPS biosynthesis
MKTLYKNYDLSVDKAYIIRIKGNSISEPLAQRCAKSCERVGMSYELWDAYDGTKNPIIPPNHLENHLIMNMIKIGSHYVSRGEIACALSHISLWSKCLEIEKPIVILEHDSIMVKPYLKHNLFNSICYLGSDEQVNHGWNVFLTPPHGSDGNNYHFICRAHAYAIDPTIARSLLCYVLKYGITCSLDMFIRADIFPIHQSGVYAYDVRGSETTIKNRPEEGNVILRNEDLSR